MQAGIEVDVASETGTLGGYDYHSIGDWLGNEPQSKEAWEDPQDPLKDKLKNHLLKASEVDPSKVGQNTASRRASWV